MGKIGLALSPQDPDVVYATIELAHRDGGFYRSSDAGGSWEKRNDFVSGGTGAFVFTEHRVFSAVPTWIGVPEGDVSDSAFIARSKRLKIQG